MGDRHAHSQIQTHPHQLHVHPHHRPHHEAGGIKSLLPQKGPSVTQIIAIVTLLPVGGTLLCLAGITLVGTLIGLAVAIPVFLLFSPVLVPAALTLGLAVAGFLTSGAFGVTGLSSLSWILNYLKQGKSVPENLEAAKRRMADAAGHLGQKTKDAGQTIQSKAQEGKEGARTT
ncbi:Ole18p [Datura stramonium]|uniref:Oleosin n=1 Tax=Datura stramonium TaxID=4076 RepID=A0ABS8SV77_DATST|nr:Ole18p [Datura stramonium]